MVPVVENTQDHVSSWYAASSNSTARYPKLEQDIDDADVCVVGGGFTGLSAAINLAESGKRVVVLEARRVGWGASGRNGGQLGSGFNKDQDWIEQKMGDESARRLWLISEAGKNEVKHRIARHGIDCALKPGLLYTCCKPREVADYRSYTNLLNSRYDYEDIRFVESDEVSEMLGTRVYHGGTLDMGAGHLHPLNYVTGLAQAAADAGVQIFEDSPALERSMSSESNAINQSRHVVRTATGHVRASQVVLAMNGYLDRFEARMAPRMMPINSFIIATAPLGEDLARAVIRDDVGVADSKFVVNYYRLSEDGRMLFGGRENYTSRLPVNIGSGVRDRMISVFPQLEDVDIEFAWGGRIAVTLNRLPHLGELEPGVFFAQGFSGHGVALTSISGKLIAKAIVGDRSDFDLMARIPGAKFPGGTLLRAPAQIAGMLYYAALDRI